jgi:hypothetical protein
MKKLLISALMLLLCNSAFCDPIEQVEYQVVIGYCGLMCIIPADATEEEMLRVMDALNDECDSLKLYE